MLYIDQIKKILRQRYPLLLIDRVLELEEGLRAKGIKAVSINEPFFVGHFPDAPIMPGVLILEAMAQLSAIIVYKKEGYVGLFTSVYSAHFLRPVLPGHQLILESKVIQQVKNLIRFKATAIVNDTLVAKAEIGLVILKQEELDKKYSCQKDA